MPVAATKHTKAGAAAFAKFFIRTIDWGYATTSTTYMRHYFQHSCVECRSVAQAIDGAARKHRRFIGDRFTIRSVTPTTAHGSTVRATVHFDVDSAEVVDNHGKFVDGEPALTDYKEQVGVMWHQTRWQVTEMTPRR